MFRVLSDIYIGRIFDIKRLSGGILFNLAMHYLQTIIIKTVKTEKHSLIKFGRFG